MFKEYFLFLFILAYLLLIFLVDYYAAKQERDSKSIVSTTSISALSINID